MSARWMRKKDSRGLAGWANEDDRATGATMKMMSEAAQK